MISLLLRVLWVYVVFHFLLIWGLVYIIFSSDYTELKAQMRDGFKHIQDMLRI